MQENEITKKDLVEVTQRILMLNAKKFEMVLRQLKHLRGAVQVGNSDDIQAILLELAFVLDEKELAELHGLMNLYVNRQVTEINRVKSTP